MITKEEFEILSKYADLIEKHRKKYQVVVTRALWVDCTPIVQKHLGYSGGTLTCAYCCTQLMNRITVLYDDYVAGQVVEEPVVVEKCVEQIEKSKGKGGRPKGSKNKVK